MPNDSRREFCLLFAVTQNVTQQHPAPGQQDNTTCDLTECKHRTEKEEMGGAGGLIEMEDGSEKKGRIAHDVKTECKGEVKRSSVHTFSTVQLCILSRTD